MISGVVYPLSALPGYPQQQQQQQQPSYQEADQLSRKKASLEGGLQILDDHIANLADLLVPKVKATMEAILEARSYDKARHTLMASGVLVGTFLQNAAANYADANITPGDFIQRSGNAVSAASYAGDRVIRIKPQFLTCGVYDLKHVLQEYSILTSLKETYDTYIYEGYIPEDSTPKALEFTADYFGIQLKDSISCMITEGSAANGAVMIIDDLVSAIKKRLRLTQKYLDCLEKMQEVSADYDLSTYGQNGFLEDYIDRNGYHYHSLSAYSNYV